jgi:transcriptional regulator with XRE-family HTH domain
MSEKSVSAFDRRLGRRLQQARLIKGLTQQQIGAIAGVSWQQVQKYESGQNRISAERLYKVSQTLGLSLMFFLEDQPDGECGADRLSDEALRLAGQIDALPDRLIRYGISNLVSSIGRAWERRERS